MNRLAFACVMIAAACGGKANPSSAPGAGSGSGGPALYAKKLAIGWGISAGTTPGAGPIGNTQCHGDTQQVFLALTDETGKQVSYPVGDYEATCKVVTPAPEMNAVTGVRCGCSGPLTEVDAVISGDEIVVLKSTTAMGATFDPMSRTEVTRIKAPGGAAIEAAP